MRKNTTLLILVLVMVVNALSYGIIIPLLYPYAAEFGIGPFGLSVLFALYSLFQFLATPLIGRLSDKYGRRPLLLFSLVGSSLALGMFAVAQAAWVIFLARALDGISGGNVSVAQAVIADSTTGEERAKGMGVLGAAFGAGFLLGPALGGLLSPYGLSVPFWAAAIMSTVGTVLMWLFLPETLKKSNKLKASQEPLIDLHKIWRALRRPSLGQVLWLSLMSTMAHFAMVVGIQSYSVDGLGMTPQQVGFVYSGLGLVSVVMQMIGVSILLKTIKSKKKILKYVLAGSTLVSFVITLVPTPLYFGLTTVLYSACFAPQMAMMVGLISEQTHAEDQGGILGINQSLQSLGQIVGPLLAGAVASQSIGLIYPLVGVLFAISLLIAFGLSAAPATSSSKVAFADL
jgi:multidrug resistance protein